MITLAKIIDPATGRWSCSPYYLTAKASASLRELMERMGHSSTRAALIYQHSSTERQRALADTLGALVIAKLGSGHDASQPIWHGSGARPGG